MTIARRSLGIATILMVLVALFIMAMDKEVTMAIPSPVPTTAHETPSAAIEATPTPTPTPSPPVTPVATAAQSTTEPPSASAKPVVSATPTPKALVPSLNTPTPKAQCVTTATAGFVPNNFKAYRLDQDRKVITVGWDDNAAGTPPKNKPWWMAWFKHGPKPGSGTGKVLMSTHTYGKGTALGNVLYGNKTKVGDVWSLSDGSGNVVCYRISSVEKIAVSSYDPESNLIYDNSGPEKMVVVICWDKKNGVWVNRVIFTAERI